MKHKALFLLLTVLAGHSAYAGEDPRGQLGVLLDKYKFTLTINLTAECEALEAKIKAGDFVELKPLTSREIKQIKHRPGCNKLLPVTFLSLHIDADKLEGLDAEDREIFGTRVVSGGPDDVYVGDISTEPGVEIVTFGRNTKCYHLGEEKECGAPIGAVVYNEKCELVDYENWLSDKKDFSEEVNFIKIVKIDNIDYMVVAEKIQEIGLEFARLHPDEHFSKRSCYLSQRGAR